MKARRGRRVACTGTAILALAAGAPPLSPQNPGGDAATTPTLRIPRVPEAPTLEGVSDPASFRRALEGFSEVDGFVQRLPLDGRTAEYATTVYVAYDDESLHVVFLATDPDPGAVRAQMVPREQIGADDFVTLMLDTDHDRRRAYVFRSNPRGVQWDALFTEGQGNDVSFDAVWGSEGWVTDWGYAVRMEIPFVSLRFEPRAIQTWGIVLSRQLARGTQEDTYWPRISSSIEGTLTQSATLLGLAGISPGRNLQAIPYTTYRAFRVLDPAADGGPRFVSDPADVSVGGDFKAIVDDRFVLDLTANPDFSQVESDLPQVTVNQRFEVFFPERRPFFMENADYFRTPLNLLFSRRVRDPGLGARFTGKAGGWGMGALAIDDRAPGETAAPGSGLEGTRAWILSGRVTRDIGQHSTVGAMFAGREHRTAYNRTAGLDARFRLSSHWTAAGQLAASATGDGRSPARSAPAYSVSLARSDRRLFLFTGFTDIHPDFESDVGFVPRVDLRRLSHFSSFFWRPEGGALTSWGPELFAQVLWDYDGQRLDDLVEGSLEWNFVGNTGFEVNYRRAAERLRPGDHPNIDRTRRYDTSIWDLEFRSSAWDWLSVNGNFGWGHQTNFNPLGDAEPETGEWVRLNATVSLRPTMQLRADNTVIWSSLGDPATGGRIFGDLILRSRWNWQWSRELSVRAIVQYETRAVDAALTSLDPRRSVNADLLITYRVNPWTAAYAGINANARDLELVEAPGLGSSIRRTDDLHGDARQFFVKLSYLLRF